MGYGERRDAAKYTNVVDKLKEYVAVHFRDQTTVAVRATEELKSSAFVKLVCPVRIYRADKGHTRKAKRKRNTSAKKDTASKMEDWEHKLVVDKYLEGYKTYKEGTKIWAENIGKCYYLVLQHCPPEMETELKNLARWEAAATDTDVLALLLIICDVMQNKKERAQSTMGLVESNAALYTPTMESKDTFDEYY